jgi:uncharacterized protein (DUF302 family)
MSTNKTTVAVAGGFVAGLAAAAVLMKAAMPALMLTTHESRFAGVDETAAALKGAIEASGWQCPAIRDMNAAMAKRGVSFEPPVRIVELCKAEYAKEVLTDNPEVSTLMPCAWGVYKKGGKVYITGMNTGLMGKLFGGTIARVMGGSVSHDEREILSEVVRR